MKLLLITVLSLLIISMLSCKKDSITSPPEDNSIPGRRDYVWTVDTLNTPYDPMFRLWGSSSNDIWTTSGGSWDQSISHFNGEQWSSFGVNGIIVPWAIYGFSYDDVYVGSESGKIWRYNGSTWTRFAELTKNGHTNLHFENIWGESPDDFYAVGAYPDEHTVFNKSVIAHFNNNSWTMLNTGNLIGNVVHLYKNALDNKIYLRLTKIGDATSLDSTIIYELNDGKYYNLYGNIWTKGLMADISFINNEVYFILGNEIARRINNHFNTILNVNDQDFNQRIWGRNSKDIFLLMTDGLAHYNGSDIAYLFYFNQTLGTEIYGAGLFEKDVFFLVYEPTTHLNLIYHGTLK